jgi:Carbohydrate binding domain
VAYQDLFGLTPGQTYQLTTWVLSSTPNNGTVSLEIHDTQGNGWVHQSFALGNSWQQISLPYTVTSNGAMRIHLYSEANTVTTYWDDVAVTPVPPVNSGFELGSLGSWQKYIAGSGTITVGSGSCRTGTFCLVQMQNSSDEVAYQDVFGLTPGQTYTVSVWVKSSVAKSNAVVLAIHGTWGGGWVSSTASVTTSWQQISQTYTVSSNGAMRIHLYELAGDETTYWDDVTITSNSGIPFSTAMWENFTFAPVSAAVKEYIYLNGRVIAVENVAQ